MSHNLTIAYQVEHGPMYYIDDVDNPPIAFTRIVNDFICSLPLRLQSHVVLVNEHDLHQPGPIKSECADSFTYSDFTTVDDLWMAYMEAA